MAAESRGRRSAANGSRSPTPPMFPPDEELGVTFKKEGQPVYFFLLPPKSLVEEQAYSSLRRMIGHGGGKMVRYPSFRAYNICYAEDSQIPAEYGSKKRWYTADLIRKCLDCQSLDEDIVTAEMIVRPNFACVEESVNTSIPDEWCSDTEPDLIWDADDLLIGCEDLVGPVIDYTFDNTSSQETEGSTSEHVTVIDLDLYEQKSERGTSEGPGDDHLRQPSRQAMWMYFRNRQKWKELVEKLPSYDLEYIKRVVDLLSGNLNQVYSQISRYGKDFDKIRNQLGTWDSKHDSIFFGDPQYARNYSVEQKTNRHSYLKEKLTVERVANWLNNHTPTSSDHPLHLPIRIKQEDNL